jgi:hypothetical protein
MEYLGAWGTLIHEKKPEVENLVSDSFKRPVPRELHANAPSADLYVTMHSRAPLVTVRYIWHRIYRSPSIVADQLLVLGTYSSGDVSCRYCVHTESSVGVSAGGGRSRQVKETFSEGISVIELCVRPVEGI